MRRTSLSMTLVVLLAAPLPAAPAPAAPAAPAPAGAPAADRPPVRTLEFPTNEAGRHAAAWFEAFNAGKDAMRKYLKTHVAPSALGKRTLEDRMELYRTMKEERGRLTPLEVKEFTESSVKVIARGERGGRLAITFRCKEEAPHALLGLQVEDLPPEEGTPEGADDAEFSRAPGACWHGAPPAGSILG